MGGFGGGNSTGGGGGGVGPAGRKSDGSYGTKKDASRASRRNEGRTAAKKAVNFIATGGVTGAVVRSVKKKYDASKEQRRRNNLTKSFKGEEGNTQAPTAPTNSGRGDGDNNLAPRATKAEGIELAKKIEKQTISDNQLVKRTQASAKGEAPKGPTAVEMAQAEEDAEAKRLLKIKRKGRKATILNVPEEELTLSTKQLLG